MSDISSVSSNMMRITGMATGMDTDSMVKKMMAAENIRLDKMKQGRQYIQWRQDGLRDVIKDFRDLRQKYLLIDSPADTNMIKSAAYSGSSVTVTDPLNPTSTNMPITVTALPGAVNGTSTVKVDQIAQTAKVAGGKLNNSSADIRTGSPLAFKASDWSNKNITFTVNGKDYKATLGAVADDGGDLETVINSAINIAVNNSTNTVGELQGKINASVKGNTIIFSSLTDSNIRISSDITELSNAKVINPNSSTLLSDLGVESGTLNITVGSGTTAVAVDSSKTVQDLISTIYNTKVGTAGDTLYSKVKVSFSELTGNLTIETRDTGSNQTLKISDSNNTILKGLELPSMVQGTKLADGTTGSTTLSQLGMSLDGDLNFTVNGVADKVSLTTNSSIDDVITQLQGKGLNAKFDSVSKKFSIWTQDGSNLNITSDFTPLNLKANAGSTGQDAIVEITPPGSITATTVTKSTNSFTVDNMTYSLVKDPNGTPYTVNLTTKPDSQDAVKKIKAFVDQYNTLVQKISDKISEKKNYDYKPLTDDQRSSMKDDQIKSWEDKAKQGILKNDGDLQSILNSMRSAFMDGVKSAGISLSEIGIDTYGGYEAITKPGQLKIDETKLKNALETRGDQVMNIFTATPNSSITDTKEKYNNTGIFKRIEDIIDKSAVTSDGNLLKKAGYVGTASESTNAITKQLKDQDNAIYEMNKKLADKQEKYYQMFARLETAMNSMNAQQSWLTQQLGGK